MNVRLGCKEDTERKNTQNVQKHRYFSRNLSYSVRACVNAYMRDGKPMAASGNLFLMEREHKITC